MTRSKRMDGRKEVGKRFCLRREYVEENFQDK
jgi:hypothetical protein